MYFNNIIGQDRAVSVLRRSIIVGRVASAYLFIGPEGVGRKTTARAFAAALNCQAGGSSGCGSCSSCRAVQKGTHPDVRFWRKEEDKKVMTIGRIRELIASLMLKPYRGEYKVAILDEADSMNWEAANAFLLTLEEPPPRTVLILIAVNHHLIPETVVSRCQRIYFQPLSDRVISDMLVSRNKISREEAGMAALMAEGSLSAAEECISETWEKAWDNGIMLMKSVIEDGRESILHHTVGMCSSREEARRVLAVLERIVRLAMRSRLALVPDTAFSSSLKNCLAVLAEKISEKGFIHFLQDIMKAEIMLHGNVNSRLVIEGLVLELSGYLKQPVADV